MPARPTVAAPHQLNHQRRRSLADEAWHRAVALRSGWLARGLATEPADRAAAEQAVTAIYRRLGRPEPTFEWVESPIKAVPLLSGLPRHEDLFEWAIGKRGHGRGPMAGAVATWVFSLRASLQEQVAPPPCDSPVAPRRERSKPWPMLPPSAALDAGVPFAEVLRQGIRMALGTTLADNITRPVRAALGEPGSVAVGWYGELRLRPSPSPGVEFRDGWSPRAGKPTTGRPST